MADLADRSPLRDRRTRRLPRHEAARTSASPTGCTGRPEPAPRRCLLRPCRLRRRRRRPTGTDRDAHPDTDPEHRRRHRRRRRPRRRLRRRPLPRPRSGRQFPPAHRRPRRMERAPRRLRPTRPNPRRRRLPSRRQHRPRHPRRHRARSRTRSRRPRVRSSRCPRRRRHRCSGVPVLVDWDLESTDAGLKAYQLEVRHGDGDWTRVGLGTPTLSYARLTVPSGSEVRYRVRAIDQDGTVGDWRSSRTMIATAYSDSASAIKWAGTWTYASHTQYTGRRAHSSNARSANGTLTFTGTAVAWAGTDRSHPRPGARLPRREARRHRRHALRDVQGPGHRLGCGRRGRHALAAHRRRRHERATDRCRRWVLHPEGRLKGGPGPRARLLWYPVGRRGGLHPTAGAAFV